MSGDNEIRGTFSVTYDHRVLFSDGVFDPANGTLADVMPTGEAGRPAGVVAFVDAGAARAMAGLAGRVAEYLRGWPGRLRLAGEPVVVPGGEAAKRGTETFDLAVRALHDAGLDRHSYALIVGGGAVLDAVGFAASVVHRGVRHVRVPTTVLGQNDAGIGVKNGIDLFGRKNFLGTFAPPVAVVNDFTLLRGLPAEHWRDGTAEAVKVALIRDGAFFEWLDERAGALAGRDEAAMRRLIFRCAELHIRQITTGGDPFERGSARPLDFGHWAAHKLEQMSNFSVTHGHAVAVGMAIDTLYAARAGLLAGADADRVVGCLRKLGFELAVGPLVGGIGRDALGPLLDGVAEFREHLGGELSITMLRGIGQAVELHEIDLDLMRRCAADVLFGTNG
jgi:3-dehydroquinate synthase